MDCSLPGSTVHGISQARILEWVTILFSKGFSQPRDQTQVSCIAGRFFTVWATREAHICMYICNTQDIIIYEQINISKGLRERCKRILAFLKFNILQFHVRLSPWQCVHALLVYEKLFFKQSGCTLWWIRSLSTLVFYSSIKIITECKLKEWDNIYYLFWQALQKLINWVLAKISGKLVLSHNASGKIKWESVWKAG